MKGKVENATYCSQWETGQCNSCGNCASKPQNLQEKLFFLFDTLCGHSSLRCCFDGKPNDMEKLINNGDFYDGASSNNIDFLFGFAGYEYRTITNSEKFRDEIKASVNNNKPVIVKLKDNNVPFAVITGYDGDTIICPDFKCAQKSPDPEVNYDGVDSLYIVGDKVAPRYSLADGLKRIQLVMDYCIKADIWGEFMRKIGTYGPDSLGSDNPEGRKKRMSRLAQTMWHTFNSHNFAEVFRTFRPDSSNINIYDNINDVKKLADDKFSEIINTINWRYGYTHDLAWSIIGLDECINWNDWKSHYYGDMLELIINKLKENDEAVLECVHGIIDILNQ